MNRTAWTYAPPKKPKTKPSELVKIAVEKKATEVLRVEYFLQQTQSLPAKNTSFQMVTYPRNEEGRASMALPSYNPSFQA